METVQFKDVAHFYFGCATTDGKMTGACDWAAYCDTDHKTQSVSWENLRVALRPVSDLTDEEYYEKVCPLFGIENGLYDKAWFIKQWDFIPDERGFFPLNDSVKVINFLRSVFIDVDGLIESGQAIDATTLPNNPYKK